MLLIINPYYGDQCFAKSLMQSDFRYLFVKEQQVHFPQALWRVDVSFYSLL